MCFWVVQMVKTLPAMRETQVQSLDQKDPLEKGMATHSSILSWRILWSEEPGGLQSIGHKESDRNEVTEHGTDGRCHQQEMWVALLPQIWSREEETLL